MWSSDSAITLGSPHPKSECLAGALATPLLMQFPGNVSPERQQMMAQMLRSTLSTWASWIASQAPAFGLT